MIMMWILHAIHCMYYIMAMNVSMPFKLMQLMSIAMAAIMVLMWDQTPQRHS